MNPSGLCLCGCGGKTTVARNSNTKKGWIKGQPKDYLRGHFARTARHKRIVAKNFLSGPRLGPRMNSVRAKASAVADNVESIMQARRQRRQKQGPYKAGATLKAKAAAKRIEAAMKRRA